MGAIAEFEGALARRAKYKFGRWHAIDLHNHSPSSFDYQGDPATALEETAKKISEANLAIVMFTDHEKLPDATFVSSLARMTRKTIVRGMELNVFVDAWGKPEQKVDKNLYFHLLIGFDPDGRQSPEYWMTHLYKKCGDTTRQCGNRDIRGVTASIDAICEVLSDAGAILIPAHLHSTRDAFRSRSVDDIYADPEFLRHAKQHFTALEITDPRTAQFFDGKHDEAQNVYRTCIRSSDAHEPALLGTRVTYAQMEVPSFSELKAALELPFRVSLTPPEEPSSYVVGLHIKGDFFPDLWLTLSPHCNALIGVKGSGKTALLETLRFALGAPVPASRQEAVDSHLHAILGTNGSVRVLLKRADGAKLLVERSPRSREFQVVFEDDRRETFTRPEGLLFPSYILGWHEIEQAATDANVRRVYLDTIAGQDQIRSLNEEASVSAKKIRHLHEVAATKYAAFRSLHDQALRLEELRRGLQELTDDNLIALRDEYVSAARHRDFLEELHRSVDTAQSNIESRVRELAVSFDAASVEGSSPISNEANEAQGLIANLNRKLEEFGEVHRRDLKEVFERLDTLKMSIASTYNAFQAEYEARTSALPKEKRRLLESHQRIMEDTKELPRLVSDRDAHRRDVESILKELSGLCCQVADRLDKRTQLREDRVATLNTELESFGVQLSVEPLAIAPGLDSLSRKYTTGAKIFSDLQSLVEGERRYHRRLAKAYESLRADLVGGFKLFFDSPEFGYFVDYFEEDDLKIRFKVGKVNEEYSPIDQLSAGQRCTAVFPLLLRLEEGPLIIDQPEDNLDNRHIADAIAPALLEDKRARQIAFTSHNANLVVLTDAEHIVSFEASGAEGRVEARGFLCASHSAITQHVMAILDGGERALELRYRKYGSRRPR